MDPMEILGSLLGQKAGGASPGAAILKEILLGGSKRQAPERQAPAPSGGQRPSSSRGSSSPSWQEPASDDIEAQAKELSDLLNVANERSTRRNTAPQQPTQPQMRQPAPAPRQPANPQPQQGGWGQESSADDETARQNDQATVLIRAMVSAAKCDGQISQAEQQSILGQLKDASPAAVHFLRDELAKPFDVREFTWSVPIGMEQQVYALSLMTIDVDTDAEQRYLKDLARGLRLAPEVCDQIKSRLTGGNAQFAGAR
jgi:uncharacterized membrane protein YebE (DUF533 family)